MTKRPSRSSPSIARLRKRRASSGLTAHEARLRSVHRAIAVTAAASAPLPQTSPMTIAQRPSLTGKAS